MARADHDVAIVGGGLAGGLTALAIRQARPDQRIALIEAQDRLGGNHRWSWFASDVAGEASALLAPFPRSEWPSYEVCFPAYHRVLRTPYRSLSSRDFDAVLRRSLPQDTLHLGRRVARLGPGTVTFENGDTMRARQVIDCRDAGQGKGHLRGGWQVFLGQTWRLDAPHKLTRPIIMDATVAQAGGYRFVYVLPLDPRTVFIEDTYYQDEPRLHAETLRARIARYVAAHGWQGDPVGEETGCLPVITGGDFRRYRNAGAVPGVVRAGAGGGFVHPLTSYTLPIAARVALGIARDLDLPPAVLTSRVERLAQEHWRATGFYRLLGDMLFGAARPARRYRVFERFYRLGEPLIERFYAARSSRRDRLRILAGRPPVPIGDALRALATNRPALRKGAETRKTDKTVAKEGTVPA
jgi:lycopene beta-cyclase